MRSWCCTLYTRSARAACRDGWRLFIVLWTAPRKKASGISRPDGSKPFFYFAGEGALCVSNTMDTLRAFAGFDEALDENFLADYLLRVGVPMTNGPLPADSKGWRPGMFWKYSQGGIKVRRAVQLPIERSDPIQTRRGLREPIPRNPAQRSEDRLANESNVVFYLSGGLDSTASQRRRTGFACDWAVRTGLRHSRSITRPLFEDKRAKSEARRGLSADTVLNCCLAVNVNHFQAGTRDGFPMPEPRH